MVKAPTRQWSEKTLLAAEEGRGLIAGHRAGILDKYPELKAAIINELEAIRMTGCRITVIGTQTIVHSYAQYMNPDIFIITGWKISDQWTRDFLRQTMGWSIRQGTTAAQKLPDHWERDAIRTCCRIAYLMRLFGIPAFFVLNMDETGVLLQPGGNATYAQRGA